MKKALSFLFACLLFLLSVYIVAESQDFEGQLIDEASSGTLFGDQQSLYMLDGSGHVQQYQPKRASFDVLIDAEITYPFVMQGEPYIFNKDTENITPLLPHEEDTALSMPITLGLAGGSSEWQLSSISTEADSVYFLFTDAAQETPLLCRYHIDQKRFDTIRIDQLNEYILTMDKETLAIARTHEETIIYLVNWDENKYQELYRLSGRYGGFAIDRANVYAADLTDLGFVLLRDGKEQARVYSPYAAGVMAGMVTQGQYYAFGSSGLYRPSYAATQEESNIILRVMEWYPDETDIAFMEAYPNVRLEYISGASYEGMDFSQALIIGLISYDIARIGNATPAVKNLIDKGYAYDLSQDPELLSLAKTMYKPIQDLIFQNEQLVFIPNNISFRNVNIYSKENLSLVGLTPNDLPKTLEESFDFIIAWRNEHGEPENLDDVVPTVDTSGDPKRLNLIAAMRAYIANYRRTGEDLVFDTQKFRALLDKAMQAAEAIPIATELSRYRSLWSDFVPLFPSTNSIVFPLSTNESPRYTGAVSGYIIDPRSKNVQMALAYIKWRIKAIDGLNMRLIFEGQHSALERPDFSNTIGILINNKSALESSLLAEERDVEKRLLHEQIDALNDRINNPSDIDRYRITKEEIDFYQQEIIPNIEFPFTDPAIELSHENSETWMMIKRYLDGQIDIERFVIELNQRERLRQMENM